MPTYSLGIQNDSGAAQNIAVYQNYPNLTGNPVVWFSQNVNNTTHHTYAWQITWGLNWGTSPQPLVPGVSYTSGGETVTVDPITTGAVNSIPISYRNGFQTGTPANNPILPTGDMEISTNTTFTVPESLEMSVAVYMYGKPIFAMQGRPNGKYLFDTHPTYYICVTDAKEGVAVSGTFVTSPTAIIYADGETDLSYKLTPTLQFLPA